MTFGSLSGMYGPEKFPGLAAYNVSKYGVIGLTEALAVDGRSVGVSAICLSPELSIPTCCVTLIPP